jgi:hypothetical protein
MLDGTVEKSVELTDETVRKRVQAIKLPSELRALFDSL